LLSPHRPRPPSEDGSIYAFDAHGTLLWKTKTTSAIDSSPAFGRDHVIYFGAFDRSLHAVDAGGHEKWTFKTGGPVSSSPGPRDRRDDGLLGSEDKKLYAIPRDGTLVWSFATEGTPSIRPPPSAPQAR
jgi:outer membrane protein assembly factor BamB